ncbi:hypothetical protein [Idiomarina xiamenensis]|uniref:Uncharacterized protein n=1 Tax=Idiomarina xiamenensis 10-D-4 TaxID=740709 RepID=K2K5X3_9GAMM|nr:hypothetical protein [Idiomarina xiamenensis]EKE78274.1 hypothetical protein A10D4_13381 [Idiomarina xiamenensis 10-D-4]
MLKKSLVLIVSLILLILLITLITLYIFNSKTEAQPVTQSTEKTLTSEVKVEPEKIVSQSKNQFDEEVLAERPTTIVNTDQSDFDNLLDDLLKKNDYSYETPKETLAIQKRFFELLKCRNLLKNLTNNHENLKKISENIVVKQTSDKPLSTLESNYQQCVSLINISITSNEIEKIDNQLTLIADKTEKMGNEKVPAVWAMTLLAENDREPKGYDKLVRYQAQKSQAIATLRKLMDKGHEQSAWHLVNLYTNPYQMDTYNQEKAREILNQFYGLEGVDLDDRLQQFIRRKRPF